MNKQDSNFDVIVVGGGASGLIAAGQSALSGAKTLLIEKMQHPGRKLRITGKGRCNIANTSSLSEFITHIHPNGKFLRQVFSHFFTDDLLSFLENIGIKTIIERGGRVFPESENAEDVVDTLIKWAYNCGVKIITQTSVKQLLINEGQIIGVAAYDTLLSKKNVKIKQQYQKYYSNAVIIATGGKSYPATGSTGDGYQLATSAGHDIVTARPALVPLRTKGEIAQKLQGLSLKNIRVNVWINEKKHSTAFGEMLFTHFGISGPIILTLSRIIVEAFQKGDNVDVIIDLKPALDEKQLDMRLLRDFKELSKKQFKTFLKGLLPQKLIAVCIELTGIEPDKVCSHISVKERKKIRYWLKNFKFEINGHQSFSEAIITAGGVNLKGVNPKTMGSKIVDGLYFAGEILDLDADTGGYNLQIAFSTGWVAGRNAAQN